MHTTCGVFSGIFGLLFIALIISYSVTKNQKLNPEIIDNPCFEVWKELQTDTVGNINIDVDMSVEDKNKCVDEFFKGNVKFIIETERKDLWISAWVMFALCILFAGMAMFASFNKKSVNYTKYSKYTL